MKAADYTEADWRQLEDRLRQVLRPHRFTHTLGVCETACALAQRYGVDISQSHLAALLHDCAKCLPTEELRKLAAEEEPLSTIEERNPALLHARAGVVLAAQAYAVEEEEILSAIRWHTTGRPAMTLLEQILFVADFIEPSRDRAPHLQHWRELARRDLDACTAGILADTLAYLRTRQLEIDPKTEETYAYYIAKSEETNETKGNGDSRRRHAGRT